MRDKVIRIIQNALNTRLHSYLDAEINPDRIPCWDSMAHLNIITMLEEEFGIEISPEDIVATMKKGLPSILEVLNQYFEKKRSTSP